MKTGNILIAALAVLAAASLAQAQTPLADFDGKTGGESVSLARTAEKFDPGIIPAATKSYSSQPQFYPEKQCFDIHQIDKDGPERFLWANFSSAYAYQQCAPNHHGVEQCEWQTISDHSARAEVTVRFRELMDGEVEVYTLCYDFVKKRGTYSIRSPFVYDEKVRYLPNNQTGFALELTPLRRKPVAPAPGLLELGAFSYDQVRGEFTLSLLNKSSMDYWGAKVQVGVELVQDKMFDSSLGVKFYEFPLAYSTGNLKITFKNSDFGSDKEAEDFRAKAKKYFVKWGFKVIGEKYTGDYVQKGQTETIGVL